VVELVGGVAAVVPAVEPEADALPIVAFARMNPPLVEAAAVLVGAAVLLAELSCRQPVTVTVFSSVVLLVDVLGVCAINAADVANAIAAVIHKVRFIYPPPCPRLQARYLSVASHTATRREEWMVEW
jgi:hypothetical protein